MWCSGGGPTGPPSGNNNGTDNGNSTHDEDIFYTTNTISEHIDVLTYFIRAEELLQTQAVIARIHATSSSNNNKNHHRIHHRIVYVPQISAIANQVLQDAGIVVMGGSNSVGGDDHNNNKNNNYNVSIVNLQMDLFPIESDLITMEYTDCIRHVSAIDQTPALFVSPAARCSLNLHDVAGPV